VIPYRKIKSILERTEDGRELLEPHRRLVHKALTETVSRTGADVIEWLDESTERGTYRTEFFMGIEHLTRDVKGLLFWKSHPIGWFSPDAGECDEEMAQRLAVRCRKLDAKGFPITSRAVLCREIQQAPAETPWKQALYRYAVFLVAPPGLERPATVPASTTPASETPSPPAAQRVRVVFWRADNRGMLALEKQTDGSVRKWKIEDLPGRTLEDMLRDDKFECAHVADYAMFERLISASQLSPADIKRAIA
jgi:hypothetical protein